MTETTDEWQPTPHLRYRVDYREIRDGVGEKCTVLQQWWVLPCYEDVGEWRDVPTEDF